MEGLAAWESVGSLKGDDCKATESNAAITDELEISSLKHNILVPWPRGHYLVVR